MDAKLTLRPAGPLLVADLFPDLGRELVRLLRGLEPEDWSKRTVAPLWSVHDVAAHLLDTALRRLSLDRDGQPPRSPRQPIAGYRDLVGFLDELNATWVEAMRRLSPRLLVDWMEKAEEELGAFLPTYDPWAPARFSVAWAGESESQSWFDVARELTERWHHQQQIRLAVGAPPLTAPRFSEPVLETFLRALPHRMAGVEAPEGAGLAMTIAGEQGYAFTVRRDADAWRLYRGTGAAEARVRLPEEAAWLLLTKGMTGAEARRRAEVEGRAELADPFFGTLAVMA